MTLWLLFTAAFCSCSTFTSEPEILENTVIISGIVSDIKSGTPIEGVKINFQIYTGDITQTTPVDIQNAYTDSKGVFSIMSDGHISSVTCIIVTEHEEYSSVRKELLINWSGTSYDFERKTFFVNDCDFHLEKSDKR